METVRGLLGHISNTMRYALGQLHRTREQPVPAYFRKQQPLQSLNPGDL
jgi:hypothetical protein